MFLYGALPLDNKQVKEIKVCSWHTFPILKLINLQAIAWAPQWGNNNSIKLPSKLLKDNNILKDLEPLGWIKTQALELPHLSLNDITSQAKTMADHFKWGSLSICITAVFMPGSVSLSAHVLTTTPGPAVLCCHNIHP